MKHLKNTFWSQLKLSIKEKHHSPYHWQYILWAIFYFSFVIEKPNSGKRSKSEILHWNAFSCTFHPTILRFRVTYHHPSSVLKLRIKIYEKFDWPLSKRKLKQTYKIKIDRLNLMWQRQVTTNHRNAEKIMNN